ncbi:hypothetical protein Y032_0744g1995, partial [Ancylostoma ceylanicum]
MHRIGIPVRGAVELLCCETHLCNTVSFYYLNRSRSYAAQYIGHIVTFIIIIAKLIAAHLVYSVASPARYIRAAKRCSCRALPLILLIVNYGCFSVVDSNPRFPERIHLDLTQFSIQPRLTSTETNNVIERICRGPSETIFAAIEGINMNAVLTYSTTDRITYREAKEQATLGDISETSSMEEILCSVIRLGPCEIDWDCDVMLAILREAYKTFMEEPTLLELSVPITIYGDIHGQYSDIWRWFHANGWPPDTRCLFLGDYVDRGRHSTEVLMLLLLLKVVMPKCVYLVRGNHEDPLVNKAYNFQSEVHTRFPKRMFTKLYRKISKVFSRPPRLSSLRVVEEKYSQHENAPFLLHQPINYYSDGIGKKKDGKVTPENAR